MKNYFLIFVFAILSVSCLAQQITKKIERVKTTNNDSIEQQRLMSLTRGSTFKSFDAIIRDRHDAVNHPTKASLLNGRYVRSFIGINLDTISKLSDHFPLYFKKAPADSFFVYEGKHLQSIENYVCPDYNPRLISLWDIMKTYTKGIPVDKCLFMVDEYLLTTDLDEFKFDDSYIDKVVVTSPKEIQSLKKGKYLDLYLVHIFTKSKKAKSRQAITSLTPNEGVIYSNNPNSKKEKMISLQEIAKKYFPDDKEAFQSSRCLFFINDMLLISDLAGIRISEDDIYTIRLFQSSELERFGGGVLADLSVIRIYLEDKETEKESKGLVTYDYSDLLKDYSK